MSVRITARLVAVLAVVYTTCSCGTSRRAEQRDASAVFADFLKEKQAKRNKVNLSGRNKTSMYDGLTIRHVKYDTSACGKPHVVSETVIQKGRKESLETVSEIDRMQEVCRAAAYAAEMRNETHVKKDVEYKETRLPAQVGGILKWIAVITVFMFATKLLRAIKRK